MICSFHTEKISGKVVLNLEHFHSECLWEGGPAAVRGMVYSDRENDPILTSFYFLNFFSTVFGGPKGLRLGAFRIYIYIYI